MNISLFVKVWIVLILLTILSAVVANRNIAHAASVILILSIFKFIGVTFYFMDLRKAHKFWRTSILVFLALFLLTTILFIE